MLARKLHALGGSVAFTKPVGVENKEEAYIHRNTGKKHIYI